MNTKRACVIVFLATALAVVGCSGSTDNPVASPETPAAISPERDVGANRVLWGFWNLHFDAADSSVKATPVRNLQSHFNITYALLPPNCDDCLKIKVNSFDPVTRVLDADVKLRNPYQITGYDVRGILYTDDYGHELRNADGWTGLWDILGGMSINPFKAYSKSLSNRIFAGSTEKTENFLVYIPIPPYYNYIQFAVDASYPSNCNEPYQITNFSQDEISEMTGASGNICIDVLDWQNDVSGVTICAPQITGEESTSLTHLSGNTWTVEVANSEGASAGDYSIEVKAVSMNSPNLFLYDFVSLTISGAPPVVSLMDPDSAPPDSALNGVHVYGDNFKGPGAEVCLKMDGEDDIIASNVSVISAEQINCDLVIPPGATTGFYDVEVTNYGGLSGIGEGLFQVTGDVFNLQDVTPPWLNFDPETILVDDGYAYAPSGAYGFFIFDVGDPLNPVCAGNIQPPGSSDLADVSGGYAYLLTDKSSSSATLRIIDVSPPESPLSVKTVGLSTGAADIRVSGGYAYIVCGKKFHIVDIAPPQTAHLVKTIDLPDSCESIAVSGNYVYAAADDAGLAIVDVTDPASAYVMNTVAVYGYSDLVDCSGQYAYVAKVWGDCDIIDISSPETAYVVTTVDVDFALPMSMDESDGYVYILDDDLIILDVDPPESAHYVDSLPMTTLGFPWDVSVWGGNAYVAEQAGGIHVVDVTPPEEAHVATTFWRLHQGHAVSASGGYAYVFGGWSIMQVVDCNPPESAMVVYSSLYSGSNDGAVSGDYAFIAKPGDLWIMDISTPEAAHVVNTVDGPFGWEYIAVDGGYSYSIDGGGALQIIDVDPVESAYIVKEISIPGFMKERLGVGNGYAYVCSNNLWEGAFLSVVDVDPPEDGHFVNSVDGYVGDVAIEGDYIYGTGGSVGLKIIDISNPEAAFIYKTVDTPGSAVGIALDGGYAFIADSEAGLQVVDIAPLDSAYVLTGLPIPGEADQIAVADGVAYVLDDIGRLRIIKLW